MIAVIDYGLGNLTSVKNALDKIGVPNTITDSPSKIEKASGIIFPGVGAAGAGMKNLKEKKLDRVLIAEIQKGKPFLGTCLGMQLLFDFSEEDNTPCLGILPGTVRKFQGYAKQNLKIPQIGWNNVRITNPHSAKASRGKQESRIMNKIKQDSFFYFVNSYYCNPTDKNIVVGETEYGTIFASIIEKENIFATQFHSEKSGDTGLQLLKNFSEVCV